MAALGLLSALFLASCAPGEGHERAAGEGTGSPGESAAPADRTLLLTGSSTVAPLVSEIARSFERENEGARVDVQAGGSSRGVADVVRGLSDVGMVSRELGSGEAEDLRAHPLALDGVALLVHEDNPVLELSSGEVGAVWTGRIEDWRELGGRAGPITVVHKAAGRATLTVFLDHFGLENGEVEPDVVVGANQQVIRTVAGNRNAVGYVSIGEAGLEADRGRPIRMLPLGGVPPTVEAVADGRYPMTRTLILVTAGPPSGTAAEFIEFARSPDVEDLIRREGFVPIRLD